MGIPLLGKMLFILKQGPESCTKSLYPAQSKVVGGYIGFTPSVRPASCVRSVAPTVLVGSISYLCILSSNFRRFVVCRVECKRSRHYRRMRNPHFCASGKRSMLCASCHSEPGSLFNIKMSSYQYRKSHCGDKTVVRSSYLHDGISFTGKMTSLCWIRALVAEPGEKEKCHHIKWSVLYMRKKIWHFKILL